ncbi:MAG: LLM class flavin-dependent oxidoreductase [Gammaproteobacteria bacterium]|nr:LLM class flavin-dependent oxidoreductase [Gammaproteobacteria bacterium]MCP5201465.1 LLM class flavin-dependent oxidoreductase [Gammaproteobacteria bacterium]
MNASRDARLDVGVMFSFRNPAAWRRSFVDVYRDEIALAEHAEALGYDTIWLTEHHFADDGYSPSLVTLAGAIAARTERVRIGFNLLLLPLYDAVRLAEDLAALDVISGGRIDVGLGQGYAPHEFAGFGIDLADRLGRFREGLDVMQGLWTEDSFSYDGKHYRVKDARLCPRPVQQPMPPLWIGATSPPAVRRAGRRGAHLLGLANEALQHEYEQARAAAGYSLDDAKVLQLHWTHVAEDDDSAWGQAGAHFHHLLSVYAGWLNAAAAGGDTAFECKVPPLADLRTSGDLLFQPAFGSPETVADILHASLAAVRTTHLAYGTMPGMDPALTRRSLERFIADVVPRLS